MTIRKKYRSNYPGVWMTEKIRRTGKEDIYFSIRYQLRGKQKEEGLGWKSGGFTARKVAAILARLKLQNYTDGLDLSLRERRVLESKKLLKKVNL